MYQPPFDPEEALQHARARANQARGIDPPEAERRNGVKNGRKKKGGTGSADEAAGSAVPEVPMSGVAYNPRQHQQPATIEDALAALERQRTMGVAANPFGFHHGGIGMQGVAVADNEVLRHMQAMEMRNRMAVEQDQQQLAAHQSALLAAARPPWGQHPGIAAVLNDPASRAEQIRRLRAQVEEDERWRANVLEAAAGAGLQHGSFLRGMGVHGGSRGDQTFSGAEDNFPAVRGQNVEVAASLALGAPAAASREAAPEAEEQIPSAVKNARSAFDLLASAAEDTLRREANHTGDLPADTGTAGSITARAVPPLSAAVPATKSNGKRKKKGVNDPKNPLGAFVFYQRKIMGDVFEENPSITFGEAAAVCGQRWRDLADAEKQEYKDLAAADKERYAREVAVFKGRNPDSVNEAQEAAKVNKGKPGRPRKNPLPAGMNKEPRRAKSAFNFYRIDELPRVQMEFPQATKAEASTECQARFKMLTKEQREKYELMAKHDKIRYKNEYAQNVAAAGGDDTNVNPKTTIRPHIIDRNSTPKKPPSVPLSQHHPVPVEEIEAQMNEWSPSAVEIPDQSTYKADSNPYYVEEEAWRYHNPPLPEENAAVEATSEETKEDEKEDKRDDEKDHDRDDEKQGEKKLFAGVSHDDLRPLPPPPPLDLNRFPNTNFCTWTFDDDTRVLHADFRRQDGADVCLTAKDEKFLLEMYERDDITVVSEGLAASLDRQKWTLDYLSRIAGDEYYHKFRRFDKANPEQEAIRPKTKASSIDEQRESGKMDHAEIDTCLSMKVKDYVNYLRHRGECLDPDGQIGEKSVAFSFKDHNGHDHTIDVTDTVMYMIDFDMVKLAPTLNADFQASFKLRETLPGGAHCMMNCVNPNGRPFMGPNLYVTPPSSFTHFHQDGHGTVDSGHLCLSGYNEVVMLRRLPERHKRHALRILTGSYKNLGQGSSFEALYNMPHGDGLGEKPQWPDNDAIARCNDMNYCVSRFILKPGQCVHINKGRLHAFRKVSNEQLPFTDCHAKLRRGLLKPGSRERVVGPGKSEILCISVAWDWMFRGVTAAGINREVLASLECAALNRKYCVQSLAIPELSILQMARIYCPREDEGTALPNAYPESMLAYEEFSDGFGEYKRGYMPLTRDICRGIFPALQYIIKQHVHAINVAEKLQSRSNERHKRVQISERPNTWENPATFALDPYGNTDFFCKLCHKELSNVYLHCAGCEILLSKDFNICLECHQEKRYAVPVQMHPLNNKRHSTINHIGNYTYDRASRCPCKNGPVCKNCNYCAGCSCRCHTWFNLHMRLMKKCDELLLLHRIKRMMKREDLEAAGEAEKRLTMALKGSFERRSATPLGVHIHDSFVDGIPEDMQTEEEDVVADVSNPSDDVNDEEQQLSAPTRKSRRRSAEPEVEPIDTSEVGTSQQEEINHDGNMRVDIDDLKVVIRNYRKGEVDTESNGEKASQKSSLSTGRWTGDERDRLLAALANEVDVESVKKAVGTRRLSQIRMYAHRNFPHKWDSFAKKIERIQANGDKGQVLVMDKKADGGDLVEAVSESKVAKSTGVDANGIVAESEMIKLKQHVKVESCDESEIAGGATDDAKGDETEADKVESTGGAVVSSDNKSKDTKEPDESEAPETSNDNASKDAKEPDALETSNNYESKDKNDPADVKFLENDKDSESNDANLFDERDAPQSSEDNAFEAGAAPEARKDDCNKQTKVDGADDLAEATPNIEKARMEGEKMNFLDFETTKGVQCGSSKVNEENGEKDSTPNESHSDATQSLLSGQKRPALDDSSNGIAAPSDSPPAADDDCNDMLAAEETKRPKLN